MVHNDRAGKIGLFCTIKICVSVCKELAGKSSKRSEIFKPCNLETTTERHGPSPNLYITSTILVYSFTIVGGGKASN